MSGVSEVWLLMTILLILLGLMGLSWLAVWIVNHDSRWPF
jgi:uncharacterized membrane protein YqjE